MTSYDNVMEVHQIYFSTYNIILLYMCIFKPLNVYIAIYRTVSRVHEGSKQTTIYTPYK